MKASVMLWFTKVLVISLCLIAPATRAQDQSSAKSPAEGPDKPVSAYRLDFSVNELEDGKKVNSRQYSLNLNSGDGNEVKIGTKVPVEVKEGEMQYIDVGTNIWSRVKERDNGLLLEARAEISSFANPDQATRCSNSMPSLRQLRINASTVAFVGKPMVVGSVDDPGSRRQFQLEVTVTKLR
jgi:hypothetical protein